MLQPVEIAMKFDNEEETRGQVSVVWFVLAAILAMIYVFVAA